MDEEKGRRPAGVPHRHVDKRAYPIAHSERHVWQCPFVGKGIKYDKWISAGERSLQTVVLVERMPAGDAEDTGSSPVTFDVKHLYSIIDQTQSGAIGGQHPPDNGGGRQGHLPGIATVANDLADLDQRDLQLCLTLADLSDTTKFEILAGETGKEPAASTFPIRSALPAEARCR